MDQPLPTQKNKIPSVFTRWPFWACLLGISQLFLVSAWFLQPEKPEAVPFFPDVSAHPQRSGNHFQPLVVDYDLPSTFSLFGESIPLDRLDIQERLDHEIIITLYRHSSTLLALKRTPRVFSSILPILKEEGLPEDFKFLAIAESNLGHAISPAGAAGIWQIMPETAKEFGLEVNEGIDERFHLEKSTRVACRYLKEANRQLGSWISSAAAYNMGTQGFKKQTEDQKNTDFFHLRLNQETARYVFRIAAIKLIWTQPESFGYGSALRHSYAEQKVRKVPLNQPVNWVEWSIQQGTTYYMLRELNPWIRDRNFRPVANITYEVLLPKH